MKTAIRASAIALLSAGLVTQGVVASAQTAGTVERSNVKTWVTSVDGKDYEVRPMTSTYFGDAGLFHIPSAYTISKGKTSFNLFRDNIDRLHKNLDSSMLGLALGYGLSSKAEVFANFGVRRNDVDAVIAPGFPNDYPRAGRQTTSPGWQSGASDATVGLKYKFLDDYMGDAIGLALRPTVKLPTASFDKGLGTGKVSAGIDLLLSKKLGGNANIHGLVGYVKNSDPDGINIGDALRWGGGIEFPVWSKIQMQAEVLGTDYREANFAQVDPVDLVVGPVFYLGDKGLFIRPAYSRNLHFTNDGSKCDWKTFSGMQLALGLAPGALAREIFVPPPPPPPPPPAPPVAPVAPTKPADRPPTVSLDADKNAVITCDTVRLRANAADADGDPLTYAWSTTHGRVVGDGPTAVLEPGCLPPGTEVTVTANVDDGHNHPATASRRITVEAKPKPQTVQRSVGPFPTVRVGGGTRLNNIDKAVLDDMATRLRQDPGSRLLIIGYADRTERNVDVLSRKRAEAVRDYLVKERGIDTSRIVTRGAGATNLVGSGAANRRAEMIFVPEGADMPSM